MVEGEGDGLRGILSAKRNHDVLVTAAVVDDEVQPRGRRVDRGDLARLESKLERLPLELRRRGLRDRHLHGHRAVLVGGRDGQLAGGLLARRRLRSGEPHHHVGGLARGHVNRRWDELEHHDALGIRSGHLVAARVVRRSVVETKQEGSLGAILETDEGRASHQGGRGTRRRYDDAHRHVRGPGAVDRGPHAQRHLDALGDGQFSRPYGERDLHRAGLVGQQVGVGVREGQPRRGIGDVDHVGVDDGRGVPDDHLERARRVDCDHDLRALRGDGRGPDRVGAAGIGGGERRRRACTGVQAPAPVAASSAAPTGAAVECRRASRETCRSCCRTTPSRRRARRSWYRRCSGVAVICGSRTRSRRWPSGCQRRSPGTPAGSRIGSARRRSP